jgi:pimeloyl-ACP methyl ester carboxylesterase
MPEHAYSTQGFAWHVTSVNGISHVWWEMGEGMPCVYFHGGGTYHGFEWARDWAGKFRMIVPHHPNFGESQDADFNSVGDYAAHYQAFFAAIGLECFHLAGASMGGHLAATYAAGHSEQVGRLILAAPAGLRSDRAPMPDFASIPPEKQSALFAADPAWIAPYWPEKPGPDWLALRQREAMASRRAQGKPDVSYPALQRNLAGLKRPTLLLWGERDRVLPLPMIEEWQRALPQAQSVVIPGGSHLLLDEFPEARHAGLRFLTA